VVARLTTLRGKYNYAPAAAMRIALNLMWVILALLTTAYVVLLILA
jgi:hypothetical protein